MICVKKLIASISLGVMAAVTVAQLGLNVSYIKKLQTKTIALYAKIEYQKGVIQNEAKQNKRTLGK